MLLGACGSVGSRQIKSERTNYNLAVQETEDSQLLLNLVRLKYHDTPVFLELTGITSQSTFESGLSNGDPIAEIAQPPSLIWKPGPNLTFSAQPTVSYMPLHGEKFAQQLLAPIKIESLMLLYRSGWSLQNILQLCVQRLNKIENAVHASGPTPETAPRYEDFASIVSSLVKLKHSGHLDFVYEAFPTPKDATRIVLHVSPTAFHLRHVQDLLKRLNLAPGKEHYPVTYSLVEHGGSAELDHLEVETRSLQGLLYFLSQAVEVPDKDVKDGLVTVTRTADGGTFDWAKATQGLLRVRSSATRPPKASTKVQYRGSWFYIADSDLVSKSTFSLVTQLVSLQSGDSARLTPVLTLPVSR
ncbi:MAG TPA: hypothetical protein DDZ88_17175 [Verrucomicrobiales bacterium]|nr:hypothetical protein [Verrucomicrobiales bacterium]